MGNWEKVFNRKPTLCCSATVVKVRLTQAVTEAAAYCFPFEVINFLLSADESFLETLECVCVCASWLRANETAVRTESNGRT